MNRDILLFLAPLAAIITLSAQAPTLTDERRGDRRQLFDLLERHVLPRFVRS